MDERKPDEQQTKVWFICSTLTPKPLEKEMNKSNEDDVDTIMHSYLD